MMCRCPVVVRDIIPHSWVFLTETQSGNQTMERKKERKNSVRPSFEVCRFSTENLTARCLVGLLFVIVASCCGGWCTLRLARLSKGLGDGTEL